MFIFELIDLAQPSRFLEENILKRGSDHQALSFGVKKQSLPLSWAEEVAAVLVDSRSFLEHQGLWNSRNTVPVWDLGEGAGNKIDTSSESHKDPQINDRFTTVPWGRQATPMNTDTAPTPISSRRPVRR